MFFVRYDMEIIMSGNNFKLDYQAMEEEEEWAIKIYCLLVIWYLRFRSALNQGGHT
jgi:hypothetical protein